MFPFLFIFVILGLLFYIVIYFEDKLFNGQENKIGGKKQKYKNEYDYYKTLKLLKDKFDKLGIGETIDIDKKFQNEFDRYIQIDCESSVKFYKPILQTDKSKNKGTKNKKSNIIVYEKIEIGKDDVPINPDLFIVPVTYKNKTFNVVRDDILFGGSKQRGAIELIKNLHEEKGCDEFVYAGPFNGAAQAALAIATYHLGLKSTVFISQVIPRNSKTKIADCFGAKIVDDEKRVSIKDLDKRANDYVATNPNKICKLPFGFNDESFNNAMVKSLCDASKNNINLFNNCTIWIVGGSATLLNILYKVFANCENLKFAVVQVGKTIWPDQINEDNTTKYIAEESFNQNAKFRPPYPSVPNYDAKLWQFVTKYGKSGDIIWNVAG